MLATRARNAVAAPHGTKVVVAGVAQEVAHIPITVIESVVCFLEMGTRRGAGVSALQRPAVLLPDNVRAAMMFDVAPDQSLQRCISSQL